MKTFFGLTVALGAAGAAMADPAGAVAQGGLAIARYSEANAATPDVNYSAAIARLTLAAALASAPTLANLDAAHAVASIGFIEGSLGAALTGNPQGGAATAHNMVMMALLLSSLPQQAEGTLLLPQATAALAAADVAVGIMGTVTGPAAADPVLASAFLFESVGHARITSAIGAASPAGFAEAYAFYLYTSIKLADVAARHENLEAFHAANWGAIVLNRLEECVTGLL